jgi:hypothetical protein
MKFATEKASRAWRQRWPRPGYCAPQHASFCFPPASPRVLTGPGKQKTPLRASAKTLIFLEKTGAGEGIRTLDPNLGKVVLYP